MDLTRVGAQSAPWSTDTHSRRLNGACCVFADGQAVVARCVPVLRSVFHFAPYPISSSENPVLSVDWAAVTNFASASVARLHSMGHLDCPRESFPRQHSVSMIGAVAVPWLASPVVSTLDWTLALSTLPDTTIILYPFRAGLLLPVPWKTCTASRVSQPPKCARFPCAGYVGANWP
ncbi:hypothetical protein BD414DRAFT_486557 [Trametes punicea]|nr:hypothetical protein BD414DRAFT_486557 [Trametes punicea]